MVSQILAQCAFTGGNPVTGSTTRNCTVVYASAGTYTITLGTGIDSSQAQYSVALTTSVNGSSWKLVDTSDTVKTLIVFNNVGNALSDAFSASITFSRINGG